MKDLVLLKASAWGHRSSTAWHAASYTFGKQEPSDTGGMGCLEARREERRLEIWVKRGRGTCKCIKKRSFQGDLISVFQYIKWAYKEGGETLYQGL